MFTSILKVTTAVSVLLAFAPLSAASHVTSRTSIHHHMRHAKAPAPPKLDCDEQRKGAFDSVIEYTCGYQAFRDRSGVFTDAQKMKDFQDLWNPAIWAHNPSCKWLVFRMQIAKPSTYSLLKKMRDFTHERFDYVETPEDVKEINESEISPVTKGGIGLGLKLEHQWTIDKAMHSISQIEGVTEDELVAAQKQLSEISSTDRVVVESVVQQSPSDGKMQNGDIVLAVNGSSIAGLTLDDVIEKQLHGTDGTNVSLEVLRKDANGQLRDLTVTITRADFADRTVSVQDIDGVRHITVGDFLNEHLLSDFARALAEAKALHLKGVDIDVRNNGGGRLDLVIAMQEMVIDRGLILTSREREVGTTDMLQTDYNMLNDFGVTVTHKVGDLTHPKVVYARRVAFTPAYEAAANDDPGYVALHPLLPIIDDDMPVVVTQNGESYSASEVLAGGIQATLRGTVNGVPSGGKGAIMTRVDLPYGGQVSVTDGQFYPGGKDTKYIGILPDSNVVQADDFGETDAQRAKAGVIIEEAYGRNQARKSVAAAQVKINAARFEDDMAKRDKEDNEPVKLNVVTAKK